MIYYQITQHGATGRETEWLYHGGECAAIGIVHQRILRLEKGNTNLGAQIGVETIRSPIPAA
jgi:hypothetical protein